MNVYVRDDGCIRLGSSVCCDGFVRDVALRIQTHAHYDHLKDFERSKGAQAILMSQPTKDLLIAEYDADIPYRINIHTAAPNGHFFECQDARVAVYPTGHFPGGMLPVVDDPKEGRLAYAADFSWPLADLPSGVDTLIVDSTYGDPSQVRNYTKADVKNALLETVRDELRDGPVIFTGHRGRLQHATQMVADHFSLPFVFTRNALKTLSVFMRHRGFSVEPLEFTSWEATNLRRRKEPHFVFAESRDRTEIDLLDSGRRVYLSPFMVPKEKPVASYDSIIRVALTDHADFNETIELVKAVCPKRVIADNSRGGNAQALADFINSELRIPASAQTQARSKAWGLG